MAMSRLHRHIAGTGISEDSSKLDSLFILSLLLTVPTIPFFRFGAGEFEIPLAIPVIAVYTILKLAVVMNNNRHLELEPGISILLVMFLAWSGASLLWASWGDLALRRLLSRGYQVYFALLAINFCSLRPPSVHRLCKLFPLLVLIPVIVGYCGFFSLPNPANYEFSYEYPRILGDRNSDTFMILTAWPMALVMLLSTNRSLCWRLTGVITAIAMGTAIFLSLSRANLAAALLVTSAIILTDVLFNKVRRTLILVAASLCIAVPILFASLPIDHFTARWEERFEKVDENLRYDFNRGAWELADRHPVTGVGLNNFKALFPTTSVGRWAQPTLNPHNSYLGTWAELGFPGLILLTMIAVWPLFSLMKLLPQLIRSRNRANQEIFMAGLGLSLVLPLSILAYNFVEDFYFWIAYVFVSLIVLTLRRSLRREIRCESAWKEIASYSLVSRSGA